ncbi:nSTAND1 domain-containing NTPase [Tolypothrix sp. VBCCA 56010]|uniref:ATP-binding protein n=1 Tax=Tolypothrix sp. VBCCA 56010 TaxID=3137731 RepID=UPI003D7C5618
MDKSTKIRNPYVIGNPISDKQLLFGREQLFEIIDNALNSKEKVILLQGQPRIGKSSVILQISNFISQDNFAFISFDLQDKGDLELSVILHKLVQEIINKLDLDSSKIKNPTILELQIDTSIFHSTFLPSIYQAINKNLVILFDEFHTLSNYNSSSSPPPFLSYLNSFIDKDEKLFIIPVVGKRLEDMPTLLSLFRRAPNQEIGLLDEKSAEQLIIKPVEGILEYHVNAVQAILELSAGHPYFTQVLCFALFAQARSKDNWIITCQEVEEIVEQAIQLSQGGLAWFRDGLSVPERLVFFATAQIQGMALQENEEALLEPLKLLEQYGVTLTNPLYEAKERLVRRGFIEEIKSKKTLIKNTYTYKVKVELIRRWFLNRYSLEKEILELAKLDEKAKKHYEEAVKYRKSGHISYACSFYEQALINNPNHFQAILELAEIFLETHKFSKAVECYKRIYKFNPMRIQDSLIEALLGYENELRLKGKYELAREQLIQAPKEIQNHKLIKQRLKDLQTIVFHARRNPFTPGKTVKVKDFIGRQHEMDYAIDQIFNSGHLAIHGSSGIGKSSFLKYLIDPRNRQEQGLETNEYFMIYLDCKLVNPFTASDFWRKVIILLLEELKSINSVHSQLDIILREEIVEVENIKQILRQIGAAEKYLTLLLDHFDTVFTEENSFTDDDRQKFLKEFRNLADCEEGRCFSTIVASNKPLNKLAANLTANNTSWYDNYLFVPIKAFEQTEVDEFLKSIPSPWNTNLDLKKGVQTITGNHPKLLQTACFLLHPTLRAAKKPDINKFALEFFRSTESFFRNTWESLNDREKLLLMLLALSHLGGRLNKQRQYNLGNIDINDFSKGERELLEMEEEGIIKSTIEQNKKVYSFASSIMEWWVIKEIENSSLEELTKKEKLFGNVTRQQVQKIQNVIEQVWKNKDAIRSSVQWFGELVAAFAKGTFSGVSPTSSPE